MEFQGCVAVYGSKTIINHSFTFFVAYKDIWIENYINSFYFRPNVIYVLFQYCNVSVSSIVTRGTTQYNNIGIAQTLSNTKLVLLYKEGSISK